MALWNKVLDLLTINVWQLPESRYASHAQILVWTLNNNGQLKVQTFTSEEGRLGCQVFSVPLLDVCESLFSFLLVPQFDVQSVFGASATLWDSHTAYSITPRAWYPRYTFAATHNVSFEQVFGHRPVFDSTTKSTVVDILGNYKYTRHRQGLFFASPHYIDFVRHFILTLLSFIHQTPHYGYQHDHGHIPSFPFRRTIPPNP